VSQNPEWEGEDFVRQIRERVEIVQYWVEIALDQPDPVAWTEGLVSIAKARLSEPAVQPTFATMAHSEIDDLHWAILAGISQRSSQPFRGTPLRQFKPV